MKIENLAPGDSIRNRIPYPGEGEYMIVEVNREQKQFKVIRCLSTKYPALNGVATYLPFDVVEESYVRVDTSKPPEEGLSGGCHCPPLGENDHLCPSSELVDGLRKAMNEAARDALRPCTCGNQHTYISGANMICIECGGFKGRVGDIAFNAPYNPDIKAPPGILKFTVVSTEDIEGTPDLREKDLQSLEEWLDEKKKEAEFHMMNDIQNKLDQLAKAVKAMTMFEDDDGKSIWTTDNWEWVFTTGRLEWFVEVDWKSWQFIPFFGINFRDSQIGLGWIFFSVTIDFGKW